MKAAIARLEISLENLTTNEPIHRAEGNIEQADMEVVNIAEIKQALAVLNAASDSASEPDVAPVQVGVGRAIDEWNRGSRSMGIGSRSVDRRGHLHPRSESPLQNLGGWIGQRVLETWDCGLDGMKLVLEGGKEVSLTGREFYAWSAGRGSLPNAIGEARADTAASPDQKGN